MSNSAFRPQPVQGYIESDERLRGLQTHAQEIMRLQRIWQKVVPDGLATASRIGQVDGGMLSIYADHGAAAAKLRQLIPNLIAALAQHGIPVAAVRVKVRTPAIHDRHRTADKAPLSPAALQQLSNLHQQLEDGSLKTALSALLNRHRRPAAAS